MSKFVPPVLRAADSYDTDAASLASATVNNEPSLVKQEFAEESDINFIVRQFGLTGQLPTSVAVPLEGDFTEVLDYQSALNAVIAADASFMQMPADVRTRFNNDPAKFLDFVHDPNNRDEARKLGLLVPEKAPPSPVEVIVRAPDGASGTVST